MTFDVDGTRYDVRRATADDLPALVAMLADDVLGATREAGTLGPYERAFAMVDADPNQYLAVLDRAGTPVGMLQLTIIPGLGRAAALRAQIESVRVHSSLRGHGLGEQFLRWAVEEARRRGATLVQLTTDRARPEAHRFYERLGFVASHVGMKLPLT